MWEDIKHCQISLVFLLQTKQMAGSKCQQSKHYGSKATTSETNIAWSHHNPKHGASIDKEKIGSTRKQSPTCHDTSTGYKSDLNWTWYNLTSNWQTGCHNQLTNTTILLHMALGSGSHWQPATVGRHFGRRRLCSKWQLIPTQEGSSGLDSRRGRQHQQNNWNMP